MKNLGYLDLQTKETPWMAGLRRGEGEEQPPQPGRIYSTPAHRLYLDNILSNTQREGIG